jgi:SAM-dependent methyltransferase
MKLTPGYWDQRYKEGYTGWDTGAITTPLKSYFDQLRSKEQGILIPGAGNAYEVEYLHQHGFKDVHVLDWARQPLENLQQRIKDFPESNLHHEDYFDHQASYDLIIEQTFFCAIDPQLRGKYVEKTSALLKPGGKLVGLLWQVPMNHDRPPYGGSENEYVELFEPYFDIRVLETAYNSIKPRAGTELFCMMTKK